jgi:uncharacterized membrane protein YeaQ/YmgE (transglycosylase-associated protein family)
MGFIVLIAVGGILGWLASILSRIDEARWIALNVVVGVVAALVTGALLSDASLPVGLSAQALLFAIIGSIAALSALNAMRTARLLKDTF